MTNHPPFNIEQVYDEQIAPLMTQIIEICKTHKMPMLATFMYQHHYGEEQLDSFCTTSLGATDDWQPDRIKEACKIIRNPKRTAVFGFTITDKPANT